ncbi:ABC transporter permease [Denitratisoma sp. DHT3]|uniref:ABC transporter permease n=1 Tax=Denitratisoma sp. DHT3 TaxID=1981880 RepID=UPI0021BDB94F|nr:ABC transporter permease [Denitratisoma sp. DHT3]
MRWLTVWRRNFLVWRKMAFTSVLGNLADPLIYMLGLGYGLGSLVNEVDGVSYIVFIATGSICASTMNGATFEALYSAFSRMQIQRTWDAILNAPVALEDVLLGEWIWAASKAVLSGLAIIAVMGALGLLSSPLVLWTLPLLLLVGLCFAALGLIVTTLAPSYDFFMYYFTLLITPMTLLSGVFFPLRQLPEAVQAAAQVLPLTHAVALARPLALGQMPEHVALHLAVLAATALAGFAVVLGLARRRLLS